MHRPATTKRVKRGVKLALLAVLALVAAFGLTACSTQAFPQECVYIVGSGAGEDHKVKEIVYPGETKGDEGDDVVARVPCNARNFIVTPDENRGDSHAPIVAWTKSTETAQRIQVNVWLTANWTLNQNEPILTSFYDFCAKYGCASDDPDEDLSKSNYATEGWNGMLRENMLPAIMRAATTAVGSFGPEIATDPARWPELAEALSGPMMDELKIPLGDRPFFCATSSKPGPKGTCEDIVFTVEKVEPTDQRVQESYDDAALVASQQVADEARFKQAETLYGPYAGYFLGLQDLAKRCAKSGCVIYVLPPDGAPAVPVN